MKVVNKSHALEPVMQDITTGLACAKILILVIGKHVIIVVMIFTIDNRINMPM